MTITEIQEQINIYDGNRWELHDGYHSFNELYEHRIKLFLALCRYAKDYHYIRISKHNSDWWKREWWFVMWIDEWYITYHLPNKYREYCSKVYKELDKWLWDWHNSNVVLERIMKL